MRNLVITGLAMLLMVACQKKETRYTQQSPEIDTYKKAIENYNNRAYDTSIYADSSQTFFNSIDKGMSAKEVVEYHTENDKNYSKRGFEEEGQEYEMVVDDQGRTWVNFWGTWSGTFAETGTTIKIPIHLTSRYINGKIVREYGYWDSSPMLLEMQKMEAQKNMPVDDKIISKTADAIVKAWNANNKQDMAAVMTANFIRTNNGEVIIRNPQEYGINMMEAFHSGFPDFKVTMDNMQTLGNKAFINWTVSGTNTQPFQDNPATNKAINIHGFSVWTIQNDGKASREDAFFDNLVLYQQLGLSAPGS